ncbi:T9SS type A sorting domain-containing protein [Fluviicola sp.]|uniref:T9SS type A sorting domain-containing protein n=1 Tax=Fluviicola sp. TaxID=1917219 RepID=UPI0031E002E0
MKNLTLFICMLAGMSQHAMSQTATGTFTQTPCNNDGVFSVSTTGVPLPITYTYYTDGGTVVHSNVNSTTDQLTGIAMSNYGYIYCQVSSGNIMAYAQAGYTPSFTFEVNVVSPLCPATMGTITATQVNGTPGPFTYSWINQQTLTSYSGNNASVPIGDYQAMITDQTTGCVLNIMDTSINVHQLSNVTATINTTNASCTNGTATAVASGGVAPYTYLWSTGATSASISGMSQGFYPLTVTDAQGCQSNNLGATILQSPHINVNVTVTNATCLQPNGSAMAFGSGGMNPYTYSWSNGQTGNNATNLNGGNAYTVIATDANGCIGQGYAYINTNTPINVSYSSTASQCTAPTGSATLAPTGGTAPYTYSWSSYPAVTGATLSNVPAGTYPFQVTDNVGCIRTGSVVVSPISTINANVQASTVICPATTGAVTAAVSGTNGPFTYQWSNGATTSSISGVPLGTYSCVITDAVSCSVTKSVLLDATSPVNVGVSTVGASCIYSTDGTATAVVSGGTAPYTYAYSNGTITQNATNLGVDDYYLTVTDANGCSSWKHFWIANANTSQSCYCTISGTVYADANANCTHDSGENGIENIMIHCSGFGYTFTDANGHYSFRVPTGTYTISEQVNSYYPLSACQSNTNTVNVVAASGCNTVVDFSNGTTPMHDLKITTINSNLPPIPGNSYQQKVIVRNEGTVTESGVQLGYSHDGQLAFVNASSPGFVQLNSTAYPNNYSVQTGFPSLNPNGTHVMLLDYSTPTNIPLGTLVNVYDTVAGAAPIATDWLTDNTPWNNVNTHQTTVIGSYDPNYKEVTPKGTGTTGLVPMETKEFDYTIHFQNEGTYFAQNISVTDQLDADFDWTTFKPGYSDHHYTATMSETGLVTFTFANINLPWKDGFGDALSSGLVQYSIQRKTTTPVGTVFTNTADIFFDYNAPITTNTTVNTLDEPASINEIAASVDGVTVDLYPVPTRDQLNIRVNNVSKSGSAVVSVIDLAGKVIFSDKVTLEEGSTLVTKNLSGLMTGTYLTRIQFENGSAIVKKIVVSNN